MKLYKKNGVIQFSDKIVIIKDDMQIFNPTEEMILEDGWVEYISTVNIPTPTDEEILERYRSDKIEDIIKYDASSEVNEFFLGETSIWLDKATRAGLKLRFEAEISLGKDTTTLWYDNIQYSLGLNKATQMLLAIELYASACYDNTQAHVANVKALENIEDIKNYDHRTGYPEKLRF
jgi:hypothetical protein